MQIKAVGPARLWNLSFPKKTLGSPESQNLTF